MAFSLWLAFFGASVLLAIAPGPDNLFVLMQSAVFGVRAGMIVVIGLATGLLLQTLAAALGIAAVVAAVPALFWAIKCLGRLICSGLRGRPGLTPRMRRAVMMR